MPEQPGNARRRISDAEVVTLCVAQAIMGIPSDHRFLAAARKRLAHLFPQLPGQAGYHKRRRRLSDSIEWLLGVFASKRPGFADDLLLIDSTPLECARSRETALRSALCDAADYGYCASHSRYFWGFRLHAIFAPDGTPRALQLASPKRDEREVGLELLRRCRRRGGETLICDKGYAGREFARTARELQATVVRPRRRDEPGEGPHLAPIRQRIESIFWTCKDLLTLEPRGPHPGRPQGAHPAALPLPGCLYQSQPPIGAPQPGSRRLLRIVPWNQSSRAPSGRSPWPPWARPRAGS